ncbi:g8654 [Coccomyxa elongata]
MSNFLECSLSLPDRHLSPEDERAEEEINHAMSSPGAMEAMVDAHKYTLAFRLWDPDADGVVSHEWLTQAFDCLQIEMQKDFKPGSGGGKHSEVVDFLERQQRPELPGLDHGAFHAFLQRFCQLIRHSVADVCDFLVTATLEAQQRRAGKPDLLADDFLTVEMEMTDIIDHMQDGN